MSEYVERLILSARRGGKTLSVTERFRRYIRGGRFGRMRSMLFAAVKEVTR